jgi:hypothetical protein
LADRLEADGDFHRLFDVRRLQARLELGMPIAGLALPPTLDPAQRDALEDRLLAACREIGHLLLGRHDIAGAYRYFQMVAESEPVREALGKFAPPDDELNSWIEIALSHRVHPRRGIEMVRQHYGLCQAISACDSILQQRIDEDDRDACVRYVIHEIHDELSDRLKGEIAQREGVSPRTGTVSDWVADRDWLFQDDNYHVDTSHLNAVVRMGRTVRDADSLREIVDLCVYGERLSDRYRYAGPEPFPDTFKDTRLYALVLLGENVEEGLARFKAKARSLDPRDVGVYPMEVYLTLLERRARWDEARSFVESLDDDLLAGLATPISAMFERAGDYPSLARLARRRHDPIALVLALAGQQGRSQ